MGDIKVKSENNPYKTSEAVLNHKTEIQLAS